MNQKIKNLIINHFGLKELDDDMNLSFLVEDSVGRIELLVLVEEALGKKLKEEQILQVETVRDLVDAFES